MTLTQHSAPVSTDHPLGGKVAIVTGASSGIGAATAIALGAQGAAVVVAGRRKERLDALARQIGGDGGNALPVAADVTNESDAHRLVERTIDEFGRLDILVNNAGVMLLSPVERGVSDEWRRMADLNLLGKMYSIQAAIPAMKEQGFGDIVNISSTAGRRSRPGAAVYAGTMASVLAFSESLRLELIPYGVRVSVVIPGIADTELADHVTDEQARQGIAALKERIEVLQPSDVAEAVTFAVRQPPRVSISEILIRPREQDF